MVTITESEYYKKHKDYRSTWDTERWDWPEWPEIREKYMGKRTMLHYDNGTCLLVEGIDLEIIPDPKPGKS